MDVKHFPKAFTRLVCVALAVVAVSIVKLPQAEAVQLTYDFKFNPKSYVQVFFADNVDNSRGFYGGGSARAVYDTVSDVLHLTVDVIGNIYGLDLNAKNQQGVDFSEVLATNVGGGLDMTFTNVSETSSPFPSQLLVLEGQSNVKGQAWVNDLAIPGKPGSAVTYGVGLSMFFPANDPAMIESAAGNPYWKELQQISQKHGAVGYYQFFSQVLNTLTIETWLKSNSSVYVGDICFNKIGGDLHADGSPVPEPTTVGLLSLGLLGLARRRFKRS